MYSLKQLRMYSVSPSKTTNTPEADVVGNHAAIGLERRDHFDLPFMMQMPRLRPQRITWECHRRWRWKQQTARRGVRPVALQTAVLSMAGFEPSRKELNIFGFRPPVFACSGVSP